MKMSSAPVYLRGESTNVCTSYHNLVDEDLLPISIRGTEYKVNIHRLEQFPGSRLYDMAKVWRIRCKTGSDRRPVYVDRNPYIFHCILDYYITGELHLPDALCSGQVRGELDYWGIGAENIAPCCLWKTRNGNLNYISFP